MRESLKMVYEYSKRKRAHIHNVTEIDIKISKYLPSLLFYLLYLFFFIKTLSSHHALIPLLYCLARARVRIRISGRLIWRLSQRDKSHRSCIGRHSIEWDVNDGSLINRTADTRIRIIKPLFDRCVALQQSF